MTREEIEHKAYLFFREKGLEYVDNIDELIEYCRDFAFQFVSYFENQIADIKANCDFAIEGRDVKIKSLEKQIEKMKQDLEWQLQEVAKDNDYYQAENKRLEEQIKQIEKVSDHNADQLANAKDIIQQFLIQNPISDWLVEKADKFIKEIEK